MQTRPNHDKGFPCTCTWQTESPLKPQDAFLTPRRGQGVTVGSVQRERIERFTGRFTEREMQRSPSWFTDAPRGRCVCNLFVKGNKSAVVLRSRINILDLLFFPEQNFRSSKAHQDGFLGGGKYCDCQENSIDLIANYTFQTENSLSCKAGATNFRKKNNFLNIVKRTWHEAWEQQTDLKRVVWVWRGVERGKTSSGAASTNTSGKPEVAIS